MKKYFISALACAVALVSCVKENNVTEQIPGKGQKITISATIPADGLTKVAFAEDGVDYAAGLKLTWEEGDIITVIDASNSGNFSVFELTGGKGTATGVFSGDALTGAESYIIQYSNEPKGFNCSEQTQATDGSTSHLKYSACLNGVSEYESFTFSEAWATSKGGTFQSSSVLRVRADIPMDIDKVQAVYIKVDEPVFDGKKEIKVNITNPADAGEPDVLTVYASLPMGMLNNIPNTGLVVQFQVSDKAYDKFTAYRPFSKIDFKAGQVNSIAIDCNTDQDITKYANKSAENIGTAANPYLIGDQHQMKALMDLYAAAEDADPQVSINYYVKLIGDIDMTGITWIPLNRAGDYGRAINFDGNGNTISNFSCNHASYPSFFGVVNGVVKDVTFDSPSITAVDVNAGVIGGYIGTGALDGHCSGITINNATVSASVSSAKKGRQVGVFGGQIGTAGSSINDCHVTGTTTVSSVTDANATSASNVGGFIGFTDKATTITDCTVSGTVKVTMNTTKTGCSAGGFIGNIAAAATITGCSAAADVDNPSSYYTGGFIGQIGQAVAATISDCAFLGGNITAGRDVANNSPVGGFVARITNAAGASFTNCYVDGANITATKSGRVGGFYGDGGNNAKANTFTSCYVKNTTISGAQFVGGFGGTLYGVASKCYVESTTITANNDNVGGFTGYLENGTATNCYATVTIIGGEHNNIGGFIGQCKLGGNVPAKAEYCFANGSVSGTAASVGAFIGGVTAVPSSVTKNIAWNYGTLPFVGSDGGLDIAEAITGNYCGKEGTISSQASTLGWDTNVWDLNGPVPTFKVANQFGL